MIWFVGAMILLIGFALLWLLKPYYRPSDQEATPQNELNIQIYRAQKTPRPALPKFSSDCCKRRKVIWKWPGRIPRAQR